MAASDHPAKGALRVMEAALAAHQDRLNALKAGEEVLAVPPTPWGTSPPITNFDDALLEWMRVTDVLLLLRYRADGAAAADAMANYMHEEVSGTLEDITTLYHDSDVERHLVDRYRVDLASMDGDS
jgi:hypothetical protein